MQVLQGLIVRAAHYLSSASKIVSEHKTYHEVLQEVKLRVDYMGTPNLLWNGGRRKSLTLTLGILAEPYVPNVSVKNTPSSCFCLLLKLFLMRLTVKQMRGMLYSKENVYDLPVLETCSFRAIFIQLLQGNGAPVSPAHAAGRLAVAVVWRYA